MGLAACFAFVIGPAGSALALDPARDLHHYNCQTWTRQNGLPVTGVHALAQTRDGFLWMGSSSGLVRFDGSAFKRFAPGSPGDHRGRIVRVLASAPGGGLWAGLRQSSFGFHDGRSFSFREAEDWPADLDVSSLFIGDDGGVWIVGNRDVFRIRGDGAREHVWSASSRTDEYLSLTTGFRDSAGRLWFGTDRRGLFFSQDGKLSKLEDPEVDAAIVWCMAEDRDGNLWVGTSSRLFCFSQTLDRLEIPPLYGEIRALLADRHGSVWAGTTGHGVARWREDGGWQSFRAADGLAGDRVQALLEDAEGSLWIGTAGGLSQLTDVKFPTYLPTEHADVHEVLCVTTSRGGDVWIGTAAGLTYFTEEARRTYGAEDGLPSSYVKRILEASGGNVCLIDGDGRLVEFDGEVFRRIETSGEQAVALAEDAGGLVVSCGGSLFRVRDGRLVPYDFGELGPPPLYWAPSLATGAGGSLLVGSHNGIYRVRDGSFQREWPEGEATEDARVGWVYEDSQGVVWAAVPRGIVRIEDGAGRFIGPDEGLVHSDIRCVIPDDSGNVWIDSVQGLSFVAGGSVADFVAGRADRVWPVAYDGPESVQPAEKTNQEWLACKSADGRLWFPGSRGIVVVDPAEIPRNQVEPPVHIDAIRINGRDHVAGETVRVPPGKGELEVAFTGLSFMAPDRMKFRYKLEGYDAGWVEAGDRRSAFYTNLDPGDYTFRVVAANGDGVWNSTGARAEIRIPPHFYQTGWFHLVVGLTVFSGAAGIYRVRALRVRRKHRALQEARDRLEAEVVSRTAEVERVHRELVEASRHAGMAEVATSVLHNVGNVLNSVSVSTEIVAGVVRRFDVASLGRIVDLLPEREADMAEFLTADPRGKMLPRYMRKLSSHMGELQREMIGELGALQTNVGHIKDIVARQQTFARGGHGVMETLVATDLVEDAIRINMAGFSRHELELVRRYEEVPPLVSDRHKILQILINLLSNAKHAVSGKSGERRVEVVVRNGAPGTIEIEVGDNGVGIEEENLTRVFQHGFTTKRNGHGFGLHSGALAADELGGSLAAHSDGPGSGARFILTLPVPPDGEGHP